jgi:ABC-type nitrate/sulfonate/taurine/bicarbonate transport systems, ATPase components
VKNKILTIKNLSKSYHDKKGEIKALEDINIDVEEKEFISIVGPSGCGKSTILSILSDLEKKSTGEIKKNKDLTIGYMLQTDSLFFWRTILDNCLIGLEVTNKLTEKNKNYVLQLLKTYGLYEFKDKYPSSLSGGMRQRVALIRTLAIKPDILLLDEPMSALDYQSRLAISNDIYNIIKKEGKTAIMVTHDIAEAVSMSDRVIVLTKRPAVVKNIYKIELSNKSTPMNNRRCKEFNKYYDMIWRDLDVHI